MPTVRWLYPAQYHEHTGICSALGRNYVVITLAGEASRKAQRRTKVPLWPDKSGEINLSENKMVRSPGADDCSDAATSTMISRCQSAPVPAPPPAVYVSFLLVSLSAHAGVRPARRARNAGVQPAFAQILA